MGRRTGGSLAAALTAVMALSGCAGDDTEFLPPVVDAVEMGTPTFDGGLEPSAAVLALVPDDVETLTVTDYEQVRLQMGLQDLTTQDAKQDRESFWTRAAAERPLLSPGMLRAIEPKLRKFGLSQLDVAWEARLYDAAGDEAGFVLAFRDGTDMTAVGSALDAGLASLEGATVDRANRLVMSGTTSDGDESWAADENTRELVGLPANATYLARGCVDGSVTTTALDELEMYSVQFEGTLATARLGEDRMDLFTRMRLGGQVPAFEQAYDGGVADPLTGRIGYAMTDPAAAASMALERALPFAACA